MAVLGSQKLTALRDIIKCEADANMQAKGLQQPSAFFYIEVYMHFVACVYICTYMNLLTWTNIHICVCMHVHVHLCLRPYISVR